MDIQKASDLPVEVHLASLDSRSKEHAWTGIENRSCQSQTVGLDQTSDTNAVTDFHLCHDSLFRKCLGRQLGIIYLWTLTGQELSGRRFENRRFAMSPFTSFYDRKTAATV